MYRSIVLIIYMDFHNLSGRLPVVYGTFLSELDLKSSY